VVRGRLRAIAACAVLLALAAPSAAAGEPGVLVDGEELVYNVRYGFIDLGQVRIRTYGREEAGGAPAMRARAYIDSYAGVPFVDLHATFESWVDSQFFSRGFIGRTKEGKTWEYARYHFDYPARRLVMETGRRDTVIERRDSLELDGPVQDGLSLFFLARQDLRSGRKATIPCIIKEERVATIIDYLDRRESVEVDAVDYPIATVAFDGRAEFVGIFGLTGDFEGWFSDDDARVPILAKMKVIIGSITIELMEWKRAGWTPPRGEG
jgi:hypothetical protein